MHKTSIYGVVCFIAFLLSPIQVIGQSLTINEIVSSNSNGIQDFEGDYPDWIELYNSSSEAVDIKDYAISDNESELTKWVFPSTVVPAGGFILVLASGKDTVVLGELHSNFKIQQTGEALFLSDPSGQLISSVDAVFVQTDNSYGSRFDGDTIFSFFQTPTPNATNVGAGDVYASRISGFYPSSFNLELTSADSSYTIRYTLNGETPTVDSPRYSDAVRIASASDRQDNFSLIPTTPLDGPDRLFDYVWKAPSEVYKTTVIRYAAFEGSERVGRTYTRTYFVDPEIGDRYTFPILSLATDSLNLFHYDTGIYIPGRRFDENGFNWWSSGNYLNRGSEWERNIHVDYFETNGLLGFETDAGMRMRGAASASYPQKSFSIYFKKEYGLPTISYPLFQESGPEQLKRLVFRNGGNEFIRSIFKDAMLQDILKPTNLDLQGFQPSVVFINGEYWGIHNIRERYDRFYFKYHFGIAEDSINILGVCGDLEEGSNTDYAELIAFVSNNDMAIGENYHAVSEKVDIRNFIDFQIAEIYFANYDWPCNNYKMWKSSASDSKWRFLIYDLDYSFGLREAQYDAVLMEHATSEEEQWPYCQCSNKLFRELLKNESFQDQFVNRFAFHLNTTFNTERVLNKLNEFESMYFPEIEEHIARWGYPNTIYDWNAEIEVMREFAKKRPCYVKDNLISFFGLNDLAFHCKDFPENQREKLLVFPNPSNGSDIKIESSDSNLLVGQYRVMNINGQVVLDGSVFDKQLRLNLADQAAGMYVIHIHTDAKTYVDKFVIWN